MKLKVREWNPQKKSLRFLHLIQKVVDSYSFPISVRQIHYRLTEIPEANHPNTLSGYAKVSRMVTAGRRAGLIDWDRVIDETRSIYKTTNYANINDALEKLFARYRQDRWQGSEYYVEVWTEKKTLISQFYPITNEADVYLASGGGFSSATYVWEAIKRLAGPNDARKEIIILYFGDLDPSGDYMNKDLEKRFAEFGISLHIKRVCLNFEQVAEYGLRKRFDVKVQKNGKVYNKVAADPRAKRFLEKHGELFQVELEALDPNTLESILKEKLDNYVDKEEQGEVKTVEKKEITKVKEKLGWCND